MNPRTLPALLLAALLLLTACGGATPSQPAPQTQPAPASQPASSAAPVKVKFGVSLRSVLYLPSLLAVQGNLWKDKGLDVEMVLVGGGSKTAAAAASGDVDFAVLGFQHVLGLQAKGQPVVAIGATQNDAGIAILMSKKWLESKGLTNAPWQQVVRAMQGARIGYVGAGTTGDLFLRYVLASQGLKPTDVTTTTVNEQAQIAGLQQGSLDGISTYQHVIEQAEQMGLAKTIVATWDLDGSKGQVGSAIVSTRAYLEKNPEVAKKFMAGIADAIKLLHTDQARALELAKQAIPGVDENVLKLAVANRAKLTPDTPRLDPAGVQKAAEWYKEMGFIKDVPTFDQLASNQYTP